MTSTLLQNVTELESVDLLNDSVISVNDSQESQSEKVLKAKLVKVQSPVC